MTITELKSLGKETLFDLLTLILYSENYSFKRFKKDNIERIKFSNGVAFGLSDKFAFILDRYIKENTNINYDNN
jgi:hypothetical protein